jgi:ribosomal protein S18 acetylase RimI-like enzyme
MAKLRQVDFAAVAPFKSAAARDRVSVSPTRDTFWFLYEDGPQIIGICALMRTTLGGRIKGVWVDPAHRGRGHGRQMTVDLIALAVDQMFFLRMEALAHNPAFYEGLGWKRVGLPQPNGAVRLARNY